MKTITLRERDSTQQVRVKISQLAQLVSSLIDETTTWEETRLKYPNVVVADTE